MNAGVWILLLVVVAAAVVGLRFYRYPGSWRHVFAPEHDDARRDLGTARDTLRGLERTARKELSRAKATVESAAAAHRRRVRRAEEHLDTLRNPGRGGHRSELGALSLHEHVLAVHTDALSADLPLHEIALRSDHSPTAGHVYLVAPDGKQHLLTYPVEEVAEEDVRRFVVDVHNAIASAKTLARERPALIRQAAAELRSTKTDTAEQEEARLRLDAVTARQRADTRIPEARRDLDAAHDRWHLLTGRRPR